MSLWTNTNGESRELLKFIYFKDSGKYYTESEGLFPVEYFGGCIYPKQKGKKLLEMQKLPGIVGGTWDGPFVVIAEYAELVLPEKMLEAMRDRDTLLRCRRGEQNCHICPDANCTDNRKQAK